MNISVKYWLHHRKRAWTILCVIMISTMAMTVGVFLARSASQGTIEKILNISGDYDMVALGIGEEQGKLLSECEDIAEWGLILNGGVCKTQYSDTVPFGALNDETAQRLFHYAPEKGGRYPKAPGEVCGYRTSFQDLGVAPVVGSAFALELYDAAGAFVGEKEFTITGVLNEADSYYGLRRSLKDGLMFGGRLFSAEEIDLPQMFLYSGDLPASCAGMALIRCASDVIPSSGMESVEAKLLMEHNITTISSERLGWLQIAENVDYETEKEMYDRAHLSYRDFYSSILIPSFFVIVLIVSCISVYVVTADAMKERLRQFGLYRSMGMSMREVKRRMIAEALFFDASGVAAGYALGVLLYAAYLWAVNAASDVRVYSAFHAHAVARAISLNPYLYPWLLAFLFSAAALLVPMLRAVRLSPNEMFSPEKAASPSGHRKYGAKRSILPRVTGQKLSGSRAVSLLIFIIGWTFVFGAAFMMGKADNDNTLSYMKMDEAEGVNADYVAQKDVYNTMVGNVYFNRHNEGVSQEDMSALAASEDTASAEGVIKLPGLKILCSGEEGDKAWMEALAPLDVENNWGDIERELFEKDKYAQGYTDSDHLYKIPSAAVDSDFMESLSPYVVSGGLDMEGLAEGKKIVIVEYPDGELTNPFSVGDAVSLTDVVIDDPYIESYDFSTRTIPEGYEPSFYYDYTDKTMTNVPGYSFGNKVVFDAQVCAVLRIDDQKLRNMLDSESYVFDKAHSGYVAPGYGILCVSDALSVWGLPDANYTDVYVNLKSGADVERFELLWYSVIGRSGDVESIVQNDIKQNIARTDQSNLILFASMICLILFSGCFGMVNTYYFAVNRNMRNLQILRAMGISRKRLALCHVRELILAPLLAVVTSLLPMTVFELVRRYAYYYAFTLGHNVSVVAENGKHIQSWSVRFPWYIELWKQPLGIIMLAAFVCLTLLNIAAAVAPLRRMYQASIMDGIRRDDF